MDNPMMIYRNGQYEFADKQKYLYADDLDSLYGANCDFIMLPFGQVSLSIYIRQWKHSLFFSYTDSKISNYRISLYNNYNVLRKRLTNIEGQILKTSILEGEIRRFCANISSSNNEDEVISKLKILHKVMRNILTCNVTQEELDGIRFS
jgi:hypothetical protein